MDFLFRLLIRIHTSKDSNNNNVNDDNINNVSTASLIRILRIMEDMQANLRREEEFRRQEEWERAYPKPICWEQEMSRIKFLMNMKSPCSIKHLVMLYKKFFCRDLMFLTKRDLMRVLPMKKLAPFEPRPARILRRPAKLAGAWRRLEG